MGFSDPTSIDLTNPINLIYYINNNSHQLFGIGMLVSIWALVLIGYYKTRDDVIGALAVSSFVAWILGLIGWIGNFIPSYFFAIVTGLTIIFVLILFGDRGNS